VLYICILSNKFDLKQTIRVLHMSVIFAVSLILSVTHGLFTLSVIMLNVVAPKLARVLVPPASLFSLFVRNGLTFFATYLWTQ
jgi:hypothetical protein